jgi:hypothetical protein
VLGSQADQLRGRTLWRPISQSRTTRSRHQAHVDRGKRDEVSPVTALREARSAPCGAWHEMLTQSKF